MIKQNVWKLTSKSLLLAKDKNHLNAIPSSDSISEESIIEQHFWVNLTIPFFDKEIGNLQSRFSEGQETVLKDILLIPPYLVT